MLSWCTGNTHGFCITGGPFADCFGANTVASALGNSTGATPAVRIELITRGRSGHSKLELFALLACGTFYFAFRSQMGIQLLPAQPES
jgi:hypothetical protein